MIKLRQIFFKLIITIILFIGTCNVKAQDYTKLIQAIGTVESGLNDKIKNGVHAGFLQISEIAVKECNRINVMKGEKTRYTLNDRYDHDKSIEMFYIIQNFYNKNNDIDYAILLWNEGNSAMKKQKRQTSYWKKVMRIYNSLP